MSPWKIHRSVGFFCQSGRREKFLHCSKLPPRVVHHMPELWATEACPVAIVTQGGRNLFSHSLPFGPCIPINTGQHRFPTARVTFRKNCPPKNPCSSPMHTLHAWHKTQIYISHCLWLHLILERPLVFLPYEYVHHSNTWGPYHILSLLRLRQRNSVVLISFHKSISHTADYFF